MVFGIVEQHGGHIDVRSAPGNGTTFRMTFPLVEALAAVGPSPRAAVQLAPAGPARVLVVDDEPMMTRAVKRMLLPSGHVVSVRFLLATGWGASIDPGEARDKGVEAVLSKPYQLVDLLDALARTDTAA